MASATAFRSFAIALAIVIAIIEPQVSGFVIHQNNTREKKVLLPVDSVFGSHNMVKGEKGRIGVSKNEKPYKYTTEIITTESPRKTTKISTNTEKVTTDNALNPTISSDTIEVLDSTEVTRDNLSLLSDKNSVNKNVLELTSHRTIEKENTITTSETTETVQFTTETTSEKLNTTVPSSKEFTTASSNLSTKSISTSLPSSLASDLTTKLDYTVVMNEQYNNIKYTNDEVSTYSNENEATGADEDVTSDFNEITTDYIVYKTTTEPTSIYTTIESKQGVDSSRTTVQEIIKANITYSNNSMEITSSTTTSEGLRLDLLPNNKTEDTVSAETAKTLSVQSTIPSLNAISDDLKALDDEIKKSATVASKRGGFLNISENTTPATTAEQYTPQVETERKPSELDTPPMARISESQRQLAEDAIREEFLKEETLSNNEQNSRYEAVRPLAADAPPAADPLRVQPIHHDKNKTLYTVSPNYKPMKKIDVQPAKPFLRDPDDNSWRNESISSLGIVFNPKNSSKSFKEVLKNKTQTELNNLQEKDNKDDVPDLRVRLEKIAEVRKTKKKKTNKDGESVYVDYEEASAESSKEAKPTESGPSKLEIPPLATPTATTGPVQTSTPTDAAPTTAAPGDSNRTTFPSSSMDNFFDRMRSLGPFTTQKAKAFNAAEYYDTTDEYDADYVTLSKIDLQREFKLSPPRPATAPRPAPTAPVKPQFPDRRPTVQYFPPLTTPRVNVNNVDVDFERKVNMFTDRERPLEWQEPRQGFVTVPPLPIATDRGAPATVPPPPWADPLAPRPEPPASRAEPPAPRAELPAPQAEPPAPRAEPPAPWAEPATEVPDAYITDDENFRRGSYIIKHYRDYLTRAGLDEPGPDETGADEPEPGPPRATTVPHKQPDYDYDMQFRREVLSRFIDNFNENSERFKADFPVLYNSSVVHRQDAGAVAASRAFVRREHTPARRAHGAAPARRACEPHCSVTVELSPAYELHYYVPEQEESEPAPPYAPRP